jgi:polynucleotide 5'-hydroxyl-kinase GRC3/NOL9
MVHTVGMRVKLVEEIIVRRSKILPVETSSEKATLAVTLAIDGDYTICGGLLGTKIWSNFVDTIFKLYKPGLKVLIVGGTDSGKSTLTTYLLNLALTRGHKVGLVDSDTGQGDLSPPGCIAGALVNRQITDLRDATGSIFDFIGVTSPRGVEDTLILAIRRIQQRIEALHPDLVIINTDGYVADGGVEYKVRLAQSLDPDIIICITTPEDSIDLAGRMGALKSARVIALETPKGVSKSGTDRVERRLQQFRHFLHNSRVLNSSLNNLTMKFFSSQFYLNKRKHIENVGKMVFAKNLESIYFLRNEGKLYVSPQTLKGMFVGLGKGIEISGFGLILRCLPSGEVSILTPLLSEFDTVHLSLIRLPRNLQEENYIPLVIN